MRQSKSAIATWCQGEARCHELSSELVEIQKNLPKSLGSQKDKNYKKVLLEAIAPPTLSQKKTAAFIELLTNRRNLFKQQDLEDLSQQANLWSEDVEQLAEAIDTWCKVQGRSQIHTELLDLQKNLLLNSAYQDDKHFRQSLLAAIDGS